MTGSHMARQSHCAARLAARKTAKSTQVGVFALFLIFGILGTGCSTGDSSQGAPAQAAKASDTDRQAAATQGATAGGKSAQARSSSGRPSGGPPGRGGPGGPRAGTGDGSRGVPVEVAAVGRQSISLYFETHGTLEAENEVDLVSRVSGPIVELATEEGQRVKKGQLLARIDDRELVAQLDVARVRLEESKTSFDRTKNLFEKELVARDAYDQSFSAYASAKGELERLQVQLEYTRITAPFNGLVIQRYVKFAEHLQGGARLFRLSDFDPLLCPIQVPERELSRLKPGQRAELTVESFPGHRFSAKVLRLSPVVDAASGTVKVTLEVRGEGRLRPGMFANVFLEMASRSDALVVPKAALALDSLGNTVYVVNGGEAERRDLELGFRNDQVLEVLSGVTEGEQLVVVGQDGLSDGTPIEILARVGESEPASVEKDSAQTEATADNGGRQAEAGGRGGGRGGRGGFLRDIDWNDPAQVERVKSRMRERGLTDDEIEERLQRMKKRLADRAAGGSGGGGQ